MRVSFLLISSFLMVFSCKNETKTQEGIANIAIDVQVERFDQLFANSTPQDFPKLKRDYAFLFSGKYKDSFWIAKIQDTLMHELADQVKIHLDDFSKIENEIADLFRHLSYYFPRFQQPRVITAISYVDYRNKVFANDSVAIISIDDYLGSDHKFYSGISKYIRDEFNQEQIVVDLAQEYAENYIFQTEHRTLLDDMIYYGKLLYFKDMVIPFKTDAEKIAYSQDKLDWAKANEFQIWQYFVDRELLFSTDSKLPGRFLNPAPFSKFQLEQIDNESPGRIGQFIGWQIVRSYMKNNEISFQDMLAKSPEEIFNNSNYKPQE